MIQNNLYSLNYQDIVIKYILVYFVVIQVVQNSDTKVVVSDVKKVFTEYKVLAFLLWVLLFGFFMSFIWNFVFWYVANYVKYKT